MSNRFAPNRDRAVEFYRKVAGEVRPGVPDPIRPLSRHQQGDVAADRGLAEVATGRPDAGLSTSKELLESEELAAELLAPGGQWNRDQPDDETVWHPATAGEAHLLRREWAQAAAQYRAALEQKKLDHHARESMRRQVERILLAFRGINIAIPSPFADTAAFFEIDRSN